MKQFHQKLERALRDWQEILSEARRKYYFLTFVHPEQLYIVYEFMQADNRTESNPHYAVVRHALEFINPRHAEYAFRAMFHDGVADDDDRGTSTKNTNNNNSSSSSSNTNTNTYNSVPYDYSYDNSRIDLDSENLSGFNFVEYPARPVVESDESDASDASSSHRHDESADDSSDGHVPEAGPAGNSALVETEEESAALEVHALRESVHEIGAILDSVFKDVPPYAVPIDSPEAFPHNAVASRTIYVAQLEENSATLRAVMALYSNLGKYPAAHQILFCQESTKWEELLLLLLRCFYGYQQKMHDSLYCIVNVEHLGFEMQARLVDEITKLKGSGNEPFYLALLICRNGTDQHLLDQFAEFVHVPSLASPQYLHRVFGSSNKGQEVVVVTSALPGQGKSEEIQRRAFTAGKLPVIFPISGPVTRAQLVERLDREVTINSRSQCLHISLNILPDPFMLNVFLFELLVIGSVSSGTLSYRKPRSQVFIEIACTLDHELLNSLPICSYFDNVQLTWNINRLIVSIEPTSPMQVVCNYLRLLDTRTVDTHDLRFRGPQANAVRLNARDCGFLLGKYFIRNQQDMSFGILKMFVEFFSSQLIHFTNSTFFTVDNLKAMMGEQQKIRSILVDVLLRMSIEFAHRAAGVASQQHAQFAQTVDNVVDRYRKMIRWEDDNHLMVVFHSQSAQTISALYKDPAKVDANVVALMRSQFTRADFRLRNYDESRPEDLFLELEKIAKTASAAADVEVHAGYALTADNLLKMVLILLRIRARIPVLIMGETGCGKTSLIKFLASVVGSRFLAMDFHAGITEKDIIEFMSRVQETARLANPALQWWVFLDEINTCDHLGLITELMCNHSMLGKPLPKNIVLLAACNPYKKRAKIQYTAGLEEKVKTDKLSSLVYRVHPLPEALIDYVWDYGSLHEREERLYITAIVASTLPKKASPAFRIMFVELIAASQRFIRQKETPESVSMRDVKRCTRLEQWFRDKANRIPADSNNSSSSKSKSNKKNNGGHDSDGDEASSSSKPPEVRGRGTVKAGQENFGSATKHQQQPKHGAGKGKETKNDKIVLDKRLVSVILALAVCYHTRLGTSALRQEYRECIAAVFRASDKPHVTQEVFETVLLSEQRGYLRRMRKPPGIAANAALLENVFVTLVCILNKIPVFVVGKPGCSKSLSMQLINSNVRGPDSPDEFFHEKPQVFVIAFQGSESSTSEGIITVFKKARNAKNDNEGVIPVVLLDEVGLAEISKWNPLKVLHGLIEPAFPKEELDIAVVGISNWALDASKMNRAIHLSRPDPDVKDLVNTGKAIHKAMPNAEQLPEHYLRALAQAYHRYYLFQKGQGKHKNFHGMRDYYSLVKCVSAPPNKEMDDQKRLVTAIERNFGGQPNELRTILEYFSQEQGKPLENYVRTPVLDLIKANIEDDNARHLMIISSGDSAVGVLQRHLNSQNRQPPITIYGSKFPEDRSEQYSYRILSQIILFMETGRRLILKDLEDIYGSLYDMLNQNYTFVGKKRNCRIALGPYSNPMCHVAPGFRCIVLVDFKKIDFSDPPFLNRFEKQSLAYKDILDEPMTKVLEQLTLWVAQISVEEDFDESDMFLGFHEDTLPSLVLFHAQQQKERSSSNNNNNEGDEVYELLSKCKEDLMLIACADGAVRASSSRLSKEEPEQADQWTERYFACKLHQSLPDFLENVQHFNRDSNGSGFKDSLGLKAAVLTYSSIHTPVAPLMTPVAAEDEIQVHKVGSFTSEKHLTTSVQSFFSAGNTQRVLVLQCDSVNDAAHILLTKSTVDIHRDEFKIATASSEKRLNAPVEKHVLLFIHVHRGEASATNERWQLDFQSGWKQVTIDSIERPRIPLTDVLKGTIGTLTSSDTFSIREIAVQSIDWAFLCMKYPPLSAGQLKHVMELSQHVKSSPAMVELLVERISRHIAASEETNWQGAIAAQKTTLLRHPTLLDALVHHIQDQVAYPLAKLIYVLEKYSALGTYFVCPDALLQAEWSDMFNKVVDISSIPDPRGPESYSVPSASYRMRFPFSAYFIQQLEALKSIFVEDTKRMKQNASGGPLTAQVLADQRHRMTLLTRKLTEDHDPAFITHFDLFLHDFLITRLAAFGMTQPLDEHISFLSAIMKTKHQQMYAEKHQPMEHVVDVFLCWWRCEDLLIAAVQILAFERDSIPSLESIRSEADLVGLLCASLLPTSEAKLDAFGGVSSWQRKLNSTLSKLPKLLGGQSPSAAIVHALRICNDFVNIVMHPTSIPPRHLVTLAASLTSVTEGREMWLHDLYVGFEFASDIRMPDIARPLDEFVVAFFLRVLPLLKTDFTKGAKYMLKHIAVSQGLIALSGTLLSELCGDVQGADLCDALVDTEDAMQGEFMVAIDDCLAAAERKFQTKDNVFAALCSDTFDGIMAEEFSITLAEDEEAYLDYFESAIATLCSPDPPPLLLVIAIAYAKFFVRTLAQLATTGEQLRNITPPVMTRINSQLGVSENHKLVEVVKTYFLKCLLCDMSLSDLRTWCGAKVALFPWLERLQWSDGVQTVMPYDIFRTWEHYDKFAAAWSRAVSRDDMPQLDEFMAQAVRDVPHQRALLGFLANNVYLAYRTGLPPLREAQKIRWFAAERFGRLPLPVRNLATYFIENFRGSHTCLLAQRQSASSASSSSSSAPSSTPSFVSSSQHHLACVAVHFLIELATNPALATTPFYEYAIARAGNLNHAFLLAGPEDTQSMALAALGAVAGAGGHTRYSCSCGYIYFVGNCGQTMQASICPQCHNPIGGEHHQVHAGNTRLDAAPVAHAPAAACTPGLVQEFPDSLLLNHSVRHMTPALYRVIHLLTHLSLHFGDVLQIKPQPGPASHRLQVPNEFYLRDHVTSDWRVLSSLLNLNSKALCAFFHILIFNLSDPSRPRIGPSTLTSEPARDEWERSFNAKLCGRLLQGCVGAENELQSLVTQSRTAQLSMLEAELCEQIQSMGNDYHRNYLPRFFRITSPADKQSLQARILNSAELADKYPFLRLFFELEPQLDLIKNLLPLLEWTKIVMSKFSHQITRQLALQTTIDAVVQKDPRVLQTPFEEFANAWNNVRKYVSQYKCHEFPKGVPEISSAAPIALCCPEEGDPGFYLCGILQYLTELQNEFLKRVVTAAAAGCSSLLYLQNGDTTAAMRACSINDVQSADVVIYEWDDAILKFSQMNLEYGKGRETLYNYRKIEVELAHKLVSGKSIIDMEDLKEFEFHRELFHGFSPILQDIRGKIPQEKLPFSKAEEIKSDTLIANKATEILSACEVVLTMMKKIGSAPYGQTISDYCTQWQVDKAIILTLKIKSIGDVQVQYFVSLYEEVEDIPARKVSEWVDPSYRKDMPESVHMNFLAYCDRKRNHEHLCLTFRRFIFRFLSVDKIRAETPLADHASTLFLCWPSEVPIDKDKEVDDFPRTIKIAHSYCAYTLLREKMEAQQAMQAPAKEKAVRKTQGVVVRKSRKGFSEAM